MSLIEVPKGATFEDMVALKGQPDIGDRINKEILRPPLQQTDWRVQWNWLILMMMIN